MIKKSLTYLAISISSIMFLAACGCSDDGNVASPENLEEKEVIYIELTGTAAERDNEFSGLAWLGDNLILLPQYPFKDDTLQTRGILFSISKERIIAYLDGTNTEPISADTFKISGYGLQSFNTRGSGYEALAFGFNDEYTYCAIESNMGFATTGYIVRGFGSALDASTLVNVESQSGINNIAEETVFIYDGRIYSIHEANGKNVNPNPVAHAFHLNLADEITLPFPNIEYRITDATMPDESGKFWVVNYFWEGDSADLKPAEDELAVKYGIGKTNADNPGIERLIQLQVAEEGIKLVDIAPIYLKLTGDGGRNWEGIARLDDRGLLIVTDKFPTTILGFVEF